ncbi:MAG: autotransporter-associated beta strand repeat-containing protein, partial [Verrucomicrobia bacterium]|nr:autotransporter-associated beta strand repeat-containing protein [Verrucomicrobiota bacterium]
AGTTYDQLDVTGTVNLGGADLIVRLASGYRPLGTPTFILINNDGTDAVTGTFNGLADGAKVTDEADAVNFIIDYHGGTGNDVVITVVKVNATGVTSVWDGGDAANTNWTDSDNWNPNGVPVAGNSLTFPAGLAAADRLMNNNFANGTSFHTLTFADSGYQVSGNQLVPTGGITATSGTGTTTFSNLVSPFVSQTFSAPNGGGLVFDGNLSMGSASPTLTLAADHASSYVWVNGDLAGTSPNAAVVIAGSVNFNGAKSFTAPLTINAGASLTIDNASALGSVAGTTTVNGTLILRAPSGLSLAENLHLNGRILSAEGVNALTGNIFLDSDSTLQAISQSLTASGVISGPGHLTNYKELTLSGAAPNSWSGGIRIYDMLQLQKPAGVCALPAGLTAIDVAGELRLLNSNQIDDAASVNVNYGLFNLNDQAETIANLTLLGWGEVRMGTSGELTLTGDLTKNDTIFTAAVNGGTLTVTSAESVWSVPDGELTVNSRVKDGAGGYAGIRKTGAGLLTLAADSDNYYAGMQIEAGTVRVAGGYQGMSFHLDGATARFEGSGDAVTSRLFVESGGGTIAPGVAGVGRFSCYSMYLDPAATFEVELQTPVAGTGYDQVGFENDMRLDGATLTIAVLGGFAAVPGDSFVIIDKLGVGPGSDGTFAGLPEGSVFTVGGKSFHLTYHSAIGNDVVLTYLIPSSGVTKTWSGGGTNANWSTGANWVGGLAPAAGDALVFPAAALQKANTNNFPAGTTFHSITIMAAGYTLAGNQVSLNAGLAATHGVSASSTVALPFKTVLAQSVTSDGGLVLTGVIDTNAKLLTFAKTGAGNLVVNGVIAGDGGLEKTGSGSLFLNAVNTYAGTTRIREGIVDIQTATSLGSTAGETRVDAAGTLVLSANFSINVGDEHLVLDGTLQASGTAPFHSWGGSVYDWSGDVTVIRCEVPLTLSGGWFAGHCTKTGSATLQLSGDGFPITGAGLTVNEGMVELALAANVSLSSPFIVGDGSGTDTLRLLKPEQLSDAAAVTLIGGVLDLNGQSETIASLTSTGGTVLQSGLPYLVVRESLTTLASAAPTTLGRRVAHGGAAQGGRRTRRLRRQHDHPLHHRGRRHGPL